MTVPCHWAFAARRFRWLTDTELPFPDVFAALQNGFVPPEFCFVALAAMKQCRLPLEDAATPEVVQGPVEYKNRAFDAGGGNQPRLARPPGAG
jgi:hypothetical protein